MKNVPSLKNEEQMNDYKGYSLFNDVMNPVIRAWNRANTVFNIKEQHGSVLATRYAKNFDRNSLLAIFTVFTSIDKRGYEQTRRDIYRNTVNV